ncbi:MAG: hypothetical protein LC792_17980, partial [Actinobacteria bacterium]|nr:hypothetical protein [Actinomycetota bacterium]
PATPAVPVPATADAGLSPSPVRRRRPGGGGRVLPRPAPAALLWLNFAPHRQRLHVMQRGYHYRVKPLARPGPRPPAERFHQINRFV